MRRATPDDKLEVLAINDNVYGGRDYLPALYDSFMSSSNMEPFVLLIDGKIVSSYIQINKKVRVKCDHFLLCPFEYTVYVWCSIKRHNETLIISTHNLRFV